MQQSKLPSLFKFMPEPGAEVETAPDHEKLGESSTSAICAADATKTPSRKGKEKAVETEPDSSSINGLKTGSRRPPRLLDVVDSVESTPGSKRESMHLALLIPSLGWFAEERCRSATLIQRSSQADLPRRPVTSASVCTAQHLKVASRPEWIVSRRSRSRTRDQPSSAAIGGRQHPHALPCFGTLCGGALHVYGAGVCEGRAPPDAGALGTCSWVDEVRSRRKRGAC